MSARKCLLVLVLTASNSCRPDWVTEETMKKLINATETAIQHRSKCIENAKKGYAAELDRWAKESTSERLWSAALKATSACALGTGLFATISFILKKLDQKINKTIADQIAQRAEIEAYARARGIKLYQEELDALTPSNNFATRFKLIWKEVLALGGATIVGLACTKLLWSAYKDVQALEKPEAPSYNKYLDPITITYEKNHYHYNHKHHFHSNTTVVQSRPTPPHITYHNAPLPPLPSHR